MNRLAWAGGAGALFGAGLVVSGLSNPAKVLNFLDVAGLVLQRQLVKP